jgi:hexokinase
LSAKNLGKGKEVVMLNDSVATLLGGRASYPDRVFDSYIGFILGTGTNTCYIEECSNIKKIPGLASRKSTMIINTESGIYNKTQRGIIDVEFDNGTKNPGDHAFEKMISGKYQGSLLLAVLKKGAIDGMFSTHFARRISEIDDISTMEMDKFLYHPYGDNILSLCCDEFSDDHMTLYYLIDSIVERAAKLITINMASILMKINKGNNPCRPVCITAEGSTFYKSKLFRSKLDYYVKDYMNDRKGLYCEFVKVENATLIGTAIAALLN